MWLVDGGGGGGGGGDDGGGDGDGDGEDDDRTAVRSLILRSRQSLPSLAGVPAPFAQGGTGRKYFWMR